MHTPLITLSPRQWFGTCLIVTVPIFMGALAYLGACCAKQTFMWMGFINFPFLVLAEALHLPIWWAVILFWIPYFVVVAKLMRDVRGATWSMAQRYLWMVPLQNGLAYTLSMPIAGALDASNASLSVMLEGITLFTFLSPLAFAIASLMSLGCVVILQLLTRLCMRFSWLNIAE